MCGVGKALEWSAARKKIRCSSNRNPGEDPAVPLILKGFEMAGRNGHRGLAKWPEVMTEHPL